MEQRTGTDATHSAPLSMATSGFSRCRRQTPATPVLPAGRLVTERFLSQQEAARLAGCSKDTIVRARRKGRFPHARLRGHCWTIPVDDLFAAGLYRATDEGAAAAPQEPEAEGDPVPPMAVELASAVARVAALEVLVARQDDELAFLRQLVVETLAKRGPS